MTSVTQACYSKYHEGQFVSFGPWKDQNPQDEEAAEKVVYEKVVYFVILSEAKNLSGF